MQDFNELSVKIKEKSKARHSLFIKQHIVREKIPEKPNDRTLFVLGVPPYCNEEAFKTLFSSCGPVANVYFHPTPSSGLPASDTSKYFPNHQLVSGYKVAYVVFETEKGLKNALKLKSQDALVFYRKGEELMTGMKKWCQEYNSRIPVTSELNEEIENYMKQFDEQMDEESKTEKGMTEPDEDGWITVTKKGRRPGFARKESVHKQLQKKEEKRKKKTELKNFYRFQIKESKMKNLVALRQKFEEDKKKIEVIKQTRKFKPF